eukprot:Pompholyxophrys_punicea_v1_NODE_211_length_2731_cov_5.482063.p2 type:complete len:144 gc:universal NODE_211_length_2731_cov_5.482063:1132-701(-)
MSSFPVKQVDRVLRDLRAGSKVMDSIDFQKELAVCPWRFLPGRLFCRLLHIYEESRCRTAQHTKEAIQSVIYICYLIKRTPVQISEGAPKEVRRVQTRNKPKLGGFTVARFTASGSWRTSRGGDEGKYSMVITERTRDSSRLN